MTASPSSSAGIDGHSVPPKLDILSLGQLALMTGVVFGKLVSNQWSHLPLHTGQTHSWEYAVVTLACLWARVSRQHTGIALLNDQAGLPALPYTFRHLLRTGYIRDFVIVSERQMVKGISRVVAVTGEEANQAREAGHALAQVVESLSARVPAAPPCLSSAHGLSKEAGLLIDAVENTAIPQWQRRELQSQLRALQRVANTMVRKLEIAEAASKVQALLMKHREEKLVVDTVDTDSISVLMKAVNQYSNQAPGTLVMLLSHQQSGKVLCACQVPKGCGPLSASDWALAVCTSVGGNAGGSTTVAKGTGYTTNITEAVHWAKEFAKGNWRS